VPQGNVFTWVLIGFPLYLLVRGRLTTYLSLATKRPINSGAGVVGANGTGTGSGPVVGVSGTPGVSVTATVQ
jgi:hypothetical protein